MAKKLAYQAPSTGMTPSQAKALLEDGTCDNPDLIAEAMNVRRRTTRHLAAPAELPPHHPDYDPSKVAEAPKAPQGPTDEDLALPQADYFVKFLAHAKNMEEYEHLEKLWKDWHKGVRRKPKAEKWDFTQEELRDYFYYHEGELYHLHDTGNNIKAGQMAGTNAGRGQGAAPRRITFRGHTYPLSSMIWFFHTGEAGVTRLIHKNHVKDDCAFENLMKRYN